MNSTKKRILVVVPDGIGVRNYLYSSHFELLSSQAEVTIWSGVPKEILEKNLPNNAKEVSIVDLKLFNQSLISKFLWETASWARLYFFSKKLKNRSLLFNRTNANWSLVWRLFLFFTRFFGTLISWNYGLISFFDKLSNSFWSSESINFYKEEIRRGDYQSILITHQRVAQLMPICLVARKTGIKVTSVIFSWDNVPKSKLAILPDYFLVWSEHMKSELQLYYREIKEENIFVTGTPQFEFYFDPSRIIPRDEFAQRFGLNPERKWICYSGDDHTTSPYDQYYLDDVLESVSSLDDEIKPEVIFRRAPVDFSSRYDYLKSKYGEVVRFIDPILLTDSTFWRGFLTSPQDIDILVNLVHHCELVINIGSTMAHDFAVLNKPCIYINYNVPNRKNWSIYTIYKFQHFRSMDDLNPVLFLNDKKEWPEAIKIALFNPEKIGPDRKKWLERIVQHPLNEASQRIVNQLLK